MCQFREERAPSQFNFWLRFGWVQVPWTSKACVTALGSFFCKACALQTLWWCCEGDGHSAHGSIGNGWSLTALLLCEKLHQKPSQHTPRQHLCSCYAASLGFLLTLLALSSLAPRSLGYKAGWCACSPLLQHQIAGEESLCPLSSFF